MQYVHVDLKQFQGEIEKHASAKLTALAQKEIPATVPASPIVRHGTPWEEITRVAKGTYFAEMHIVRGGEVVHVDARPSDSIAIALRFPAPIYADESLLVAMTEDEPDEGVVPETPPAQSTEDMTVEQLQKYLSNLRPEDFGKFNL
jgi:hypothetical protein